MKHKAGLKYATQVAGLGVLIVVILTALILLSSVARAESGLASYYSSGKRTACGNVFRPHSEMTAAHRRHPCGTMLRVTHRRTGKSVVVRVTDRGPFIRGRVVDLSLLAAKQLGITRSGVAPVVLSRH